MPYNYPYNLYNAAATPSVPSTQLKSTINWVQGIEGAKAAQMQPNSATVLMDSENEGVFYIKSCDNIGICTLRTFMYEEVTQSHQSANEYVTRQELEKIIEDLKKDMKDE